jgi:hypothetical protein
VAAQAKKAVQEPGKSEEDGGDGTENISVISMI